MKKKTDLLAVDEDMYDEVSKINKLIDDEKKKQDIEVNLSSQKKKDRKLKETTQITNKDVEPKITAKAEKNMPKNKKRISTENTPIKTYIEETVITMERLHLRVFDNSIDILYRPNHSYVTFLPNDENGRAEVKRLAEMSREEFGVYLDNSRCFKRPTRASVSELKNSSLEEWYKGAWSLNTKNLLKELGVENPIEEPLYLNN